jgi:hypothetical protein
VRPASAAPIASGDETSVIGMRASRVQAMACWT